MSVTPYMTFATQVSAPAGTTVWTNPTNAHVQDASSATVALTSAQSSEYLKCTSLELLGISAFFNSVQITGLEILVYGTISNGVELNTWRVHPIKAGVLDTTNYIDLSKVSLLSPVGGAGSLFNQSWTPADMASSTFGLALKAVHNSSATVTSIGVDAVSMRIYYEPRIPFFFF